MKEGWEQARKKCGDDKLAKWILQSNGNVCKMELMRLSKHSVVVESAMWTIGWLFRLSQQQRFGIGHMRSRHTMQWLNDWWMWCIKNDLRLFRQSDLWRIKRNFRGFSSTDLWGESTSQIPSSIPRFTMQVNLVWFLNFVLESSPCLSALIMHFLFSHDTRRPYDKKHKSCNLSRNIQKAFFFPHQLFDPRFVLSFSLEA